MHLAPDAPRPSGMVCASSPWKMRRAHVRKLSASAVLQTRGYGRSIPPGLEFCACWDKLRISMSGNSLPRAPVVINPPTSWSPSPSVGRSWTGWSTVSDTPQRALATGTECAGRRPLHEAPRAPPVGKDAREHLKLHAQAILHSPWNHTPAGTKGARAPRQ